jgi:peptide/nickel transport system ATP-binding protein/oligopeptide transport system ATP-binding protein
VEALRLHNDISKKEAWTLAAEWLEKVKIPDVNERMFAYPFQLSGGMQQRVMIAMAMMMEPDLIIADEPTTALDVTIQARIFALIKEMRLDKTSILLITHDMGVIWEMCDRVVVMYASRIAEEAGKGDIFEKPAHPYTRGLLNSIPKLRAGSGRLEAIPGQVPSPYNYPSGCHFRDRCPHAFDKCAQENPPLIELGDEHRAACWIADKLIHQGFSEE